MSESSDLKERKDKYNAIMEEMNALPVEKRQDFLLSQLALIQPQVMLQDLMNPALRNAALYNAVTALLKHHKIEVDPIAGAKPSHPLGALAHGLPPSDWDDGAVGVH